MVKHGLCVIALLLSVNTGSAATLAPKIVGGDDAPPGTPWMTGLHYYNIPENAYTVFPFCGGSLIAPGWVVTAAHCLDTDPVYGGSFDANELLLRINQPDIGPEGARIQPDYQASAIISHGNYNGSVVAGFDIALVQLDGKVAITPVSIATSQSHAELGALPFAGNQAVGVLGWGGTDSAGFNPDNAGSTGAPAETLQFVILDYLRRSLIPGNPPANVVGAWEPSPDPDTQPFGADTCFGDSGGPLFVSTGNTQVAQASSGDVLVGLTSYGSAQCNSTSSPGVYTRVQAYSAWIEQQTSAFGDPLTDLTVDLKAGTQDLAPGSTTPFTLTVTNASIENSATAFALQISGTTNVTLNLTGDADLSCSKPNATTLDCASTGTLMAGGTIEYGFSATDTSSIPRNASITASLSSQDEDDYRVSNNQSLWDINFTTETDVAVEFTRLNSSTGRVDVQVSNLSDAYPASDVTVNLLSNLPLNLSGDATCNAVSSTEVNCALGDIAPLDSVSRTINLPRSRDDRLSYDLTASITQSSSDRDASNDTASETGFVVGRIPTRSSGGALSCVLLLPLSLVGIRRRQNMP